MHLRIIGITGIQTALLGLYITNRSLTSEKHMLIRDLCRRCVDSDGYYLPTQDGDGAYASLLETLLTYGIKHEHQQLLRFIEVHFYVEGLHRGAQDDFDAHAARLEIIRSTTRTVKGAKYPVVSKFYQGKILPGLSAIDDAPEQLTLNGEQWDLTPWGYVLHKYANDADVLRGMTGLGVSSNFVAKVPYGEHLQHIYDLRRQNPRGKEANPELQEMMELLRDELDKWQPKLGYYLGKVWSEREQKYIEKNIATY